MPVSSLGLPGAQSARRFVYELRAASEAGAPTLTSSAIELNGVRLQTGPRGEVPELQPLARASVAATVTVAPHTARFVVFEDLPMAACALH